MSIINSQPLIGASGQGGYFSTKSLRFRSSASAYLSRTATNPTNAQKGTFSAWIKRGKFTQSTDPNNGDLVGSGESGGYAMIQYYGQNLYFGERGSNGYISTAAVFRDPSAWYHVFCVFDTTLATANDRLQIWVNGVRQTAGTFNVTPTQNSSFKFLNENGQLYNIGAEQSSTSARHFFDGYMAEVYFIDGQALTPSSFGETSTSTGVWIPKKYTGTYGTNGFYLPFTDVATTSGSNAGLGKDFSGNGNYWTTNNISVTSGSTYDSMKDVPTLTDTDTANYCVLNPLSNSYSGTTIISITDGNLNFSDSSSSNRVAIASMTASSGKWYFEMTSSSTGTYAVGLMDKISNAGSFYRNNGTYSSSFGGGGTSGYSSWTSGDVIGVAWDADAGKLWFAKNNTWQSGSPSAGTSPTNTFTAGLSLFADIYTDNSAGTKSGAFNFGQRPFAYTPPTGFKALNTFNLPTPTIGATASTQAGKYFNPVIWTGTGGTRSITGVGFQPDFVWAKARSQAYSNIVFDSNRGVGKSLLTDTTGAEVTNEANGYISSFDADGFSSNFSAAANYYFNQSGTTYVAWNWKANGSGSTNTAGSITSTVSANTTAGFSIATYTGNGSTGATIGHGLGVTPSMVICKKRSSTGNWITYHTSTGINQYLYLNSTSASNTASPTWGVSSTTITFQQLFSDYNDSGVTYVAYCFAQVAGYSAFGSYTGNGSSDGVFVYTGFRPRYIMIKPTNVSGEYWQIIDTSRNPYNADPANMLSANLANAESGISSQTTDILSNGFKLRGTGGNTNGSGNTYIYMAFAESPFKYSLAR